MVFGKLMQGSEVLRRIESVGDEEGIPTATVKIIYCGELLEGKIHISAYCKVIFTVLTWVLYRILQLHALYGSSNMLSLFYFCAYSGFCHMVLLSCMG